MAHIFLPERAGVELQFHPRLTGRWLFWILTGGMTTTPGFWMCVLGTELKFLTLSLQTQH